ncbi:hypothetical protein [Methylorubrum extorquens]|jgi:hypothetical protein|uniref:Uncharacterized protein n=1 Tax=Methylorubrum extorquens DSM 13060 TaxID=882800 RepID=H1KV24_METEX|nr:hypothetical protein [Methylorubrum extorquens]EHP77559.1 hypothetical protein MetexDRAFT_6487 [Methylorubrum extorquens DSM 13060]
MNRHNLATLGGMLYGPRYLRMFADALTNVGPRTVHESHLGAWIRGDRPVPAWLAPQAKALLPIALRQILDRVHNLTRIALTPDFFDADGAEFVEDPEDEVETDEGL